MKYFLANKDHGDLARLIHMAYPHKNLYWEKNILLYTNQLSNIKNNALQTVFSFRRDSLSVPYVDMNSSLGIYLSDSLRKHSKDRLAITGFMITKVDNVPEKYLKEHNYTTTDDLIEDLSVLHKRKLQKDYFLTLNFLKNY